jgi:succinyl-diaminopimelate desuccinylase
MEVGRICSELVAIRSENPPGRTAEVIEYIQTFFENLGIRSDITRNAGGHYNLLTTGTHDRILFCGHVDVVPALDEGWTHPPFSGTLRDGFVWGRGATDMKGGCASVLAACALLVEKGKDVPPTCAFVCDEETGGKYGIRHLLEKRMIKPTDCLIAEPTPVRHPSIGQKGLCRFHMKFSGTPAHGSLYPAVGVSAVMEAVSLLQYVKGLHDREYPVDARLKQIIDRSTGVLEREFQIHDVSEVLTRLMYNPGVIRGGEKSNVVAQHCDVELELRLPWGCRVMELIQGIESHAPNGKIISRTTHEPSITDPASRLVIITCSEVDRVYGGPVFPIVQWAASDARHLRLSGFNVIQYGPGIIPALHAVDERVSVESMEKASEGALGSCPCIPDLIHNPWFRSGLF